MGSVAGEGWGRGVGEEVVPAVVAPEGFQTHQGLVTGGGPELAGALESTLILTTGGFDGAGTQWLVGQAGLLWGSGARFDGFAGGHDRAVVQPVLVVFPVLDLGAEFAPEGLVQAGLELFEGLDDLGGLIFAEGGEQGSDPLAGFWGIATIEVVGDFPEVLVGVPEVQALAGVGEAIGDEVPNPEGAIGDDEDLFGLAQTALDGFIVELAGEGFEATAGGDVATLTDDGALGGGLSAVVQAEDGAHVYPVPAVEFLALGAEGVGLAPVITLADVPGVDLDDQGEGLGWGALGGAGQGGEVLPGVELGEGGRTGLLGFEALAMGLAMEGATGEDHAEALSDSDGLFGRHFGGEQSADFLEVRGGGSFVGQA